MLNCLLKLRREHLALNFMHGTSILITELFLGTFAQLWSFTAWFSVSFEPKSFFLLKEVPQARGIKLGEENKSSKRRQNCKRSEERWTLNDSCYLCNWLCNYPWKRQGRVGLRCWPDTPCLQAGWSPARYFFGLGSTLHWNLLRR